VLYLEREKYLLIAFYKLLFILAQLFL